jgi:hypothetical protein
MEYLLFMKGDYSHFLKNVKDITGDDWLQLRKNSINVPKVMKKVLVESEFFPEDVYEETKKYLDDRIESFNPNMLTEELQNYIEKFPNERIVFIIDELSEAILTNKVNLLELEGVSESLSALPMSRVWTIAIAQEYLDNIINSVKYVSHREVSKVIDRFKFKVSLSSDDIDTIIKERLLKKKKEAINRLSEAFNQNSGKIIDLTNLKSKISTKTTTPEGFITYYPFHHYQFKLLNNFIQAVYTKTNVTERGLIIAIFAVLRNIKEKKLFKFATAYNLTDGAKQNIDSDLAKKFTNAEKILKDKEYNLVDGAHLLKTIYFINESSQIEANADNITKLYLDQFDGYYELKPEIEKALNDLCDANLLLNKNNSYAITSDLEREKIEEMQSIDVPLYDKKREFTGYLKKQDFIKDLSYIFFENQTYRFSINTRQGEELFKHSKNNELKIQVESIYSIESDQMDDHINKIKLEMSKIKDAAVLIPLMEKFTEIDRKVTEIYRYRFMEDRYQNDSDPDLRAIIRDFSQSRNNRQKELETLIAEAYLNGIMIYDFSETDLNKNHFENLVTRIQEKMICNTFTERLPVQLSEDLALKILKADNTKSILLSLPDNPEVKFFDSNGNFIGDGLKVIENVTSEISQSYVSGIDLEEKFGRIPYGYDYSAILVSLASLMRAGRLAVKHNGRNTYDYRDNDLFTLFKKSTEFKKGSFKAITATITATQKQELVEKLKELEAEKYLNTYFDYNTNDLQLARTINDLSECFINQVSTYKRQYNDFNDLFPGIETNLTVLREYTQTVTGDNFKQTIEKFLNNYSQYQISVNKIQKTIRFCEKNLNTARKYKSFVEQVKQELEKIGRTFQNSNIFNLAEDFNNKYNSSVCDCYSNLQQIFQSIKDEYYHLMENEHKRMTASYFEVKQKAQEHRQKVASISEDLNQDILRKIDEIIYFADRHCCDNLEINFETKCENCHYSLNEIVFANQIIENKNQEIEKTKTQITFPDPKQTPKEIKVNIKKGKYTVPEYRKMLQEKINEAKTIDEKINIIIE